ncbi:Sec-independent protein translocase protein TatB [Pseudonocardia spinosispora]|uniref:Sec-independent protein translocase protein TatB n=1 Tax=Pseudonocardia spinosispora TaxID=103441 RepID=UPI0004009417|nr:Sec-independent protein translocase protein TatB [Pseudonocardia spinosispora]
MFENIGWGEILVLLVAALFILGPERLPEAAAWLGRTIRQVKDFASGARDQLSRELGPEFDELRKPLQELRNLRDFDPRRAAVRTLFEDDEPKPNGFSTSSNGSSSVAPPPAFQPPPRPTPLSPGERPPIDPDAT